jgi:hypothetical protein
MNTSNATSGMFIDMQKKEKELKNPMYKLAAKTKGKQNYCIFTKNKFL